MQLTFFTLFFPLKKIFFPGKFKGVLEYNHDSGKSEPLFDSVCDCRNTVSFSFYVFFVMHEIVYFLSVKCSAWKTTSACPISCRTLARLHLFFSIAGQSSSYSFFSKENYVKSCSMFSTYVQKLRTTHNIILWIRKSSFLNFLGCSTYFFNFYHILNVVSCLYWLYSEEPILLMLTSSMLSFIR